MKLLLLSLIIISLTSCYEQKRECLNFHTGTFQFETFVDDKLIKTTFVRNDTLEVDYYLGKSDSAHIRWINNCEFIVNKIHPKNRNEKKAIHFKILTTSKDSYSFEYGLVGEINKKQGTAKKIK